jgi:Bacterial Ig domain
VTINGICTSQHQPLTYTVLSFPSHGSLVGGDIATGTAVYTPKTAFTGSDTFTYSATDTWRQIAPPATITITVTASVTPVQIAALLARQIRPTGKAAKIGSLLKRGGFSFAFKALEAGTAVLNWYQLPPGAQPARKAKPKPVLIATGHRTFRAAGTATMNIKLTATGKRLLKHAKRLKVTARATFTPPHQHPIVANTTFTLRH